MLEQKPQDIATVSIEGIETKNHRVSSEILIRVVEGFQKIAWILGANSEGKNFDKRFRPSDEIKEKHKLEWGIPQLGSYVLPVYFLEEQEPGVSRESDLLKMNNIFSAISQNDSHLLRDVLPDSRLRERLLVALKGLLPQRFDNWQLKYTYRDLKPAVLNSESHVTAVEWLSESISGELNETLIIKGELLKVDFEAKKVTVRYPPTKCPLECYYCSEIEDTILESRKGIIEVTGKFVLDENGHPKTLTEVTTIQPVDLSKIVLNTIEGENYKLVLSQPLVITPTLDLETSQIYTAVYEALSIHAFGYTREELLESLIQQIFFVWEEFGSDKVSTASLTENAIILQKNLRDFFQENS